MSNQILLHCTKELFNDNKACSVLFCLIYIRSYSCYYFNGLKWHIWFVWWRESMSVTVHLNLSRSNFMAHIPFLCWLWGLPLAPISAELEGKWSISTHVFPTQPSFGPPGVSVGQRLSASCHHSRMNPQKKTPNMLRVIHVSFMCSHTQKYLQLRPTVAQQTLNLNKEHLWSCSQISKQVF